MTFNGKTALVTGGASGIGLATATQLAQAGARVYIGDINEEGGRKAAAEINATFVRLDITSQESVEACRKTITDAAGGLDILVNAAGWSQIKLFAETDAALWQKVIELNYTGMLKVSHAFLPGMIDRKGGRIVNVASDAGRVGSGGEAVYSGAKGAVIAFTKALAREVARYQINVNCVCPGPTDTPLLASVPEKHREALAKVIPFRRFAKPSEVADAIEFFASDKAAYLTGQVLSVSGGLTMVD